MNEGEVRQLALMNSIMLESEAIKAGIQGMIAENKSRELCGQSLAYTDNDFEYE